MVRFGERHRHWYTKLGELDKIRRRISVIDKQILELIAQRLELAKEMRQLKVSDNKQITNLVVEEHVFARNKQTGKTLNLPEKLTTDITSLLISYATSVQKSDS